MNDRGVKFMIYGGKSGKTKRITEETDRGNDAVVTRHYNAPPFV